MTLEEIEQQIKVCQECRLCEKRTNAVPGEGNKKAELVFIGEGPGKNEDIEGRPFVGSAGKFLNAMLESVGMKREDVFITNIVKCRPPNNRDPEEDEAQKCVSLYLWNQLELISPVLIATLGRHSMYRFLPSHLKISDVHGKPKKVTNEKTKKTFNILPLYHPAAALYNGGLRETLEKDFKN
ncbi:uracil-DNA glycosylase, partial [Candidatus Azambacteria bacterium]|nr:uracil-DNA glycosylase [Candidatus Azambacteria bacterium]